MSPKAGQSENMADQSASIQCPTSKGPVAIAQTSKPAPPSEYIPVDGDVIEFESKGEVFIGLFFGGNAENCINTSKGSINKLTNPFSFRWNTTGIFNMSNVTVLSNIEVSENDYEVAGKALIAYFSKPATPEFTGSYEERQRQWVEFYGLTEGDKVEVVRSYDTNEDGYEGTGWDSVGDIREFRFARNKAGVCLSDGYFHPYFVLEPVE